MSSCTVCAQGKVHGLSSIYVCGIYICANKTSRHKDSQVKLSSRRLKVDVGKYYFKDDSDETIELKVMQDDFDNKGIPLSYMNSTSILHFIVTCVIDGEVLKAISVEEFPGFVKLLHEDRDSSFEDHFQVVYTSSKIRINQSFAHITGNYQDS